MVVFTGFDPFFRDPLDRLMARARAQGYNPRLVSGQRDAYGWPGYGGQSQAELYAARGKPGGPAMAAPPGQSAHQPGLAADISGVPQSWLAANAPGLGLNTIPGDAGHVELANWRQAAATQPPTMSWDQAKAVAAANRPSQYAGPVAAETSSSGGNFAVPPGDHRAFIENYAKQIGVDPNLALGIAGAEGLNAWSAKNPNAASTVDVSGGQPYSFGDFQLNIHPGAVGAQALAAGVDPRDPNQWQAADKFALDYMKAHGVGAWSGDPVAKAYMTSGAVPSGSADGNTTGYTGAPAAGGGVGPSIASGVVRMFSPDAANRMEAATQGGIGPALLAAAGQGGGQVGPGPGNVGPVTGFLPGAPTTGSADNSAKAAPVPGAASPAGAVGGIAGAAQKLADSFKPQDQTGGGQQQDPAVAAQQATAQQAATLAAMQQQRMAMAAQMAAQMQKGPPPLRWGKTPPGAGMGMIGAMGQGTPTPGGGMVGQGDMGMTLNSLDNLYG